MRMLLRMLLRMFMVSYKTLSIQSTPLAFVVKSGDLFEKKYRNDYRKKVLDSYTHYAVTFNFVAPPPCGSGSGSGSGSGTILGLSVSMRAIRADADQVYTLCRTILLILHVKCLLCLKADAMCLSRVVGRPSIIP
jgi:hypothetical protein